MNAQCAQQNEYVETELGLIPRDWKIERVVDVCEVKSGGTPSTSRKEYWKGGNIPWIKSGQCQDCFVTEAQRFITKKGLDNSSAKMLKANSTLIAMVGATVGKTGFLTFNACSNQNVASLFSKDGSVLDSLYLFYCLQSRHSEFTKTKGFVIANLSFIRKLKIPIPPIVEQKNIAFVLSKIQNAKEKTEAIINSLKELKKSLMKHLFTYGVVNLEDVAKVKLKETEIGTIPEHWAISKVGQLFEIQQGKQLSAKESHFGKIKKPFLRTANVFWGKTDLSSVDSMYFTDKEIEKLKLEKNDVLVCEGGDVGRTALWKGEIEDSLYQNHLYRLRPLQNNYDPLFFVLWMEYAVTIKALYVQSANRTTIPNLSSSRLKEFVAPMPDLTEQKKLVSIFSALEVKIEVEEGRKRALEELFKSMLQNLMTAKIRVNSFGG